MYCVVLYCTALYCIVFCIRERITGELYGYASDVWSLGLTMLAVSLGRFPLRGGGGYWDLIKAICDDPPPSPPEDLSPGFHQFCTSCLQKDPSARLSAADLLQLPLLIDPPPQVATPSPSPVQGGGGRFQFSPSPSNRGVQEIDIVNSIRVAHLERVLDKISSRLSSHTGGEGGGEWDDDHYSPPPAAAMMDDTATSLDSLDQLFQPPLSLPPSILKTATSTTADEKPLPPSSRSQDSLDESDDKRGGGGASSSARSVHFQVASPSPPLRSRLNLKSLELKVIDDDYDDDDDEVEVEVEEVRVATLQLPNTSSYFVNTAAGGGMPQHHHQHQHVTAAEYISMIPKLNYSGMSKWRNLSVQLQLPLELVLAAVKRKFSASLLADLEENR